MKHINNQTNNTTANQSPKMNNYLLVKIALAGIISSLLLILLINLIFYVRLGTPIIDTNLKSAFGTFVYISCLVSNLANRLASFLRSRL